ncbi:MAG TPA: hypothetical protein VKG25_20515, partial [Bryobacteraceae bacterium]|nr:hypothetical protein [Bryobacteraceae bacterium]
LFVPVQIPLLSTDSSNLGQRTGTAVLVSTDATGAGAYAPVTGNASGLAPMQVNGTTALAVYEVLYADPNHTEAITIPIAAAYGSNVLGNLPQGALSVQTGFAPISAVPGTGDSTVPLPRFFSPNNSQVAFSVDSCSPDLIVAATHAGNLTAGNSGVLSLVVKNVGGVASSGTVSVADTLPTSLTATSISGTGWNCSLSGLSCSRSDSLNSDATYLAININVTVAGNAPASVVNSALVSGGGESNASNDTASDLIQITPVQTITVGTSPSGLAFTVDGFGYAATQTFQWLTGSTHSLSVNGAQTFQGTQYVFDQWSDSQAQVHSITVGSIPATYLATYLTPGMGAVICYPTSSNPPLLRAEGRAELVGDLLVQCTGGTPTPSGMPIPKIDFHVSMNSNVTSKLLAPGYSEALLLIDDPHTVFIAGSTPTLLACGAPGSNDDGTGVCSITSTGNVAAEYNGSTGHPNVFQAQLGATNELVWKGVPFDPPGSGQRVLWFTNIRVDGSTLPAVSPYLPQESVSTITALPGGLAINTPQLILGYGNAGLVLNPYPASPAAGLSPCVATNPAIATNPNSNLDSGGQNGTQFQLHLQEGVASFLKVKNFAQQLANTNFTTLYPADVNQDILGNAYDAETAFFNGSLTDPADPNYPFTSVGATPEFPAVRGLTEAGHADSGTRFYVRFAGIPEGVTLFVPSTLPLTGSNPGSTTQSQTGVAVLTASDTNGAGPYSPVRANAAGLAPVAIANGTGMAVYEVLYSSPYMIENLTIPVAVAYSAPLASPTTITAEYGLAPLSTTGTADMSSPIPRFAEVNTPIPAFTFPSCSFPDLAVSVRDNGIATGQVSANYNITVTNAGNAATSGSVSVVDFLSSGLTTAITGTGWSCNFSTLTCNRGDSLAPQANYPDIVVTAALSSNLTQYTNTATVSGGGDLNAANNTGTDTTDLQAPGAPLLSNPANGAGGVFTTPLLTWEASPGAKSYNVYIGLSSTPPLAGQTTSLQFSPGQLIPGKTYYWQVTAVGAVGSANSPIFSFTTGTSQTSKAGFFRAGFLWVLDVNGDEVENAMDLVYAFGGIPGDIPITGDWNGDGHTKIGIYRPSNGLFILDSNGNGVLDAGDAVFNLHIGKSPGDVPLVGDWNGDGRSKVGYFRQGFLWILDTNGNHIFEQGIDQVYAYGGVAGDVPVVGDWTGTGTSKIGVFRQGFLWVLDANGNGTFDGNGPDFVFPYGGIPGDVPVVGDWTGTGITHVGIFRQGFLWALDANGDRLIDAGDFIFGYGGIPGDIPVVGKW